MKSYRLIVITIILLFYYLISSTNYFAQKYIEDHFNCFSILVGKNASKDGSVLFAHNEDDGGPQLVNYYKVPRIKRQPGETITLSTGAVIPQESETFSFLWFEMPGMHFSDSYMNEWGVVISSDACASREDNPQLTDGGIGYWLRRLVAERAKTAKQGVKIAGKLLSQFGYKSSGRTYIIADSNEGWMLSAVYGKQWVAQRVPDDMVAVIPNYYTIGRVDLADTNNFLGSPDLIDYAVKRGWYDPDRDGDFNFARVYSSPGNLKHPGNIHRIWRGVNLLAEKKYDLDDEFPFSFKSKQKVTVQDLMSVLRDHYVETELDKTEGYKLGTPYKMNRSTICANTTQYGFVAQLRNWLPIEIGVVIWLAQHRPDSQAFIPWYLGINKVPDGYAYGDFKTALDHHFEPADNIHERSDRHAFWSFVNLAEKVDENYG
ncbi:C69 family dipeptidase, partial [candidate division KSB1 bacterium]|nr:C69 family dipeptidase [candidate division KSB1 bacterium]